MLLCVLVYAQELPDIIPPTPNAASLGKYGEVPIGMFTGAPNINIPLHTVSLNNYSMPISLAYNSNGIKVDGYSSSVGTGWDLMVGGVISRRINDDPDELTQVEVPDPETKLYTKEMLDFLDHRSNLNGESDSFDYQPDLFSFSFNGYSGQFFLKRNSDKGAKREAVLLKASPLKIEVNYDGIDFTSFVITDPNGIKYTFDAIEKASSYSSCVSPTYIPRANVISNAWYLTEVSLPNNQGISFTYESKKVIYDTGITQSVTRENAFNNGQDDCPSQSDDPCKSTTATSMLYVKEIRAKDQKIIFSYSPKEGMPTGMDKLNTIEIKDQHNRLLKKYNLNYNSYSGSRGSGLNMYLTKEYHNIRFFLNSVTEENRIGVAKNPYIFEYDTPNSLPSRFSFSQDHWGFFNGINNLNFISKETVEKVTGNTILGNLLNNFKAADRSASFLSAKKGLLTKITYPTKGYSTLNYEPNSYSVLEEVYPASVSKTLWADTGNTDTANETIIISDIGADHFAKINFLRELKLVDENGLGSPDPNLLKFTVLVQDLTTNENLCIVKESANSKPACNNNSNNQISVTKENINSRYLIQLKKDHSYKFTVVITKRRATKFGFYIQYYNEAPVTKRINKEVGGGRIFKTENFDSNNFLINTKKYHYNSLENPEFSSGFLIKRNLDQTILENEQEVHKMSELGKPAIFKCNTTTLLSNTAIPTYGGAYLGYETVIEEFGKDFSAGGTEYVFDIERYKSSLTLPILGGYLSGTPLTNHFGLGKPIKEVIFKKRGDAFLKVNTKEMRYKYDDRLNYEQVAYNIRKRRNIIIHVPAAIYSDTYYIKSYDMTRYSIIRRWQYLDQTIQKQYDENGENPIATTTNYEYANSDHLQQTKVETVNSTGKLLKSETKYAHDVNDTRLINEYRIAVPLENNTYKKIGNNPEVLLSHKKTEYSSNHNAANLYLPKTIQTLKGNLAATNPLEDRVVYHSYDDKGNPTEVSKKDGAKIYYVWGYQQTQPIAKIEGYTAVQLLAAQSLIKAAIVASDNDVNAITEDNLRSSLNRLRDNLSATSIQITTFTYDPLIGITSITDPRGQVIYYEYDNFNRLEFVKDSQKNILKESQYNYKN